MIIETLRAMTIPGTGQIGAHEVFTNAIAISDFTVGIKFKEKNVVLTNTPRAREWREVRAHVAPTAQAAVSSRPAGSLLVPVQSQPGLL